MLQLHVCHRKLAEIWQRMSKLDNRHRKRDVELAEWIMICYKLDLWMMFIALATNTGVTYLFYVW